MTHPVAIYNITRNTLLASGARFATGSRQRRRGLIGREGMCPGEALVIKRCRQVHTFGMRFPIDVVFIDRRGRVIRMCLELPPRKLSPVAWRAREAIELPAGASGASKTAVGDAIRFEEDIERDSMVVRRARLLTRGKNGLSGRGRIRGA